MLRLTPLALTVLVLALLAPWGFVWLRTRPLPPEPDAPASQKPVCREIDGPWGNLHVEPILLDCPSGQNLNDLDLAPYRRWVFADASVAHVGEILAGAGVDAGAVAAMLCTAVASSNAVTVYPPDVVVRKLTPPTRAALYAIIGRNGANVGQNAPFCYRGASLREWFAGSAVSKATRDRIEPLLYRRGPYLLFSDPQLVLPSMDQRCERLELVRTLRRMSTLRLRVGLKPNERPDAVLAYWGHPEKQVAKIEPLLSAMRLEPDGLSVLNFLPPFARLRLYTYPTPDEPGGAAHCNCHWASVNFFNEAPDDAQASDNQLSQTLTTRFEPLDSTSRLGDVILLFSGRNLVHSCVYVAGDVVFTKNGAGTIAPYMLQRLDDVVDGYREMYGPITLGFCRRKGT